MAHNITIREDGFAEIAWVGQTPWHGLGQELDRDADIETWRKAAGFDWSIQSSEVQFAKADGWYNTFPKQRVLYRSDNDKPLSIVSDRYQIVQPADVLDFFANLTKVSGFRLHTAGSLNGGKRLWALAETGKLADVTNNDQVAAYLLLATSCDKGLATQARFTSVRVVCANTLAMEERGSDFVSVPHSTVFDAEKVQAQMGIQVAKFDGFVDQAKELSRKELTEGKFKIFLGDLIAKSFTIAEDQKVEDNRAYKKILELFDGAGMGSELTGSRGTYWGAVNAVTEYVDHHRPARTNDSRLNHAWFSGGDSLKTRAFEMALAA
jgi:phage/plasmid-like protein (TIGR03299 family)